MSLHKEKSGADFFQRLNNKKLDTINEINYFSHHPEIFSARSKLKQKCPQAYSNIYNLFN